MKESNGVDTSEIIIGNIRILTKSRRVFVNDKEVDVKTKEYELLTFLIKNKDMVFSRETLYERIWGLNALGDNATVVVHINRLRDKIEDEPSQPKYIQTVRGAGYRFKV